MLFVTGVTDISYMNLILVEKFRFNLDMELCDYVKDVNSAVVKHYQELDGSKIPFLPQRWYEESWLESTGYKSEIYNYIDSRIPEDRYTIISDTVLMLTMPMWQSIFPRVKFILILNNPSELILEGYEAGMTTINVRSMIKHWLRLNSSILYNSNVNSRLVINSESLHDEKSLNVEIERIAKYFDVDTTMESTKLVAPTRNDYNYVDTIDNIVQHGIGDNKFAQLVEDTYQALESESTKTIF